MRAIAERRFEEVFKPSDPIEEWTDVVRLAPPDENIWTVVEDDFGRNLYAVPGYHLVNRLYYVVTERPWTDEFRVALYMSKD